MDGCAGKFGRDTLSSDRSQYHISSTETPRHAVGNRDTTVSDIPTKPSHCMLMQVLGCTIRGVAEVEVHRLPHPGRTPRRLRRACASCRTLRVIWDGQQSLFELSRRRSSSPTTVSLTIPRQKRTMYILLAAQDSDYIQIHHLFPVNGFAWNAIIISVLELTPPSLRTFPLSSFADPDSSARMRSHNPGSPHPVAWLGVVCEATSTSDSTKCRSRVGSSNHTDAGLGSSTNPGPRK